MFKVFIIQRVLTIYRVPFFQALREELSKSGLELELIYGKGDLVDRQRGYLADLDWGKCIEEKYVKLGKYSLVFQPYLKYFRKGDLVVVGQEIKYLLNYLSMLKRTCIDFRLAFWGHCMNYQELPHSFLNLIKRRLNNLPDWWFAYTKGGAQFLEKNGFPSSKISIVQNSVDTKELLEEKAKITEKEVANLREKLGIEKDASIGLFCGGMYKEKRLRFLFEACRKIKEQVPGFHMVFMGGGPQEGYVRSVASKHTWMHFVGPVFDNHNKVLCFKMSDVLLSPGLVGLAILDGFALDLPLITTDYPFHSPEIEYLDNGKNGIMTEDRIESYCKSAIDVLTHHGKLKALRSGCNETVKKYTMEKMVENFSEGIIECFQL